MTSSPLVRALVVTVLLLPAAAFAGSLQRYTLIVGVNNGGADRARLKYAVSDAERVAGVMIELGGVTDSNAVLLKEPRVGDLLAALGALETRLANGRRAAAANGDRTEFFFYYSGHADEHGLLLGDDRLSYRTLRDRLDEMPADVRVAVLDACASGAFTRLKGGRKRPPFLVDPSAATRGHAFLTSSAETESAQESDRIGASYFTHYLVSGFRGAADVTGDGRVTLNEAYQFAFAETLGRTVDTKAGAQHPSYDINLTGSGDVVMTDVRQTTARLMLAAELEGRFFVRDAQRRLVVELYKPKGRPVEIALEPGTYDVRIEHGNTAMFVRTDVADGARLELGAGQFAAAAVEPARRRGSDLAEYSVEGRHRLTMHSGGWGWHHGPTQDHSFDYVGGLQYAHYFRENLALAASLDFFGAEEQIDVIGGAAIPMTVQWNPRPGNLGSQRLKPFLGAGIVAVSSADSQTERRNALGAHVNAGFDYQVAHTFAVGLQAGYNFVPDLQRPSGLHDNFNGPQLLVRVGWLFGQGR